MASREVEVRLYVTVYERHDVIGYLVSVADEDGQWQLWDAGSCERHVGEPLRRWLRPATEEVTRAVVHNLRLAQGV